MSLDIQQDIDAVNAIEQVPAILQVICQVTGVGFAAIARVTEDRWVCLAVNDQIDFGLKPGGELKVETTLCHEIRQSHESVVIDHVASDQTYVGHHTPAMYGFQSYISVPIFLKDGSFFGTLCAIDPKPRRLKEAGVIGMFRVFANLIGKEIESGERLVRTQHNLAEAKSELALREQFIAVLGHDLRNPLAAVSSGLRLLGRARSADQVTNINGLMQKSIARMAGLIDNLLDFARGRLGGGLTLTMSQEPLEPVLTQVIEELRIVHPDRVIDFECVISKPVVADHVRIAQLLSNLLSNALTHGAPDAAVQVKATTGDDFELTVCNTGNPIPPENLDGLFRPFSQGTGRPSQNGLGLGLYIVSEIARAHGGTIDVTSDDALTCFTFRMPLRAPSPRPD